MEAQAWVRRNVRGKGEHVFSLLWKCQKDPDDPSFEIVLVGDYSDRWMDRQHIVTWKSFFCINTVAGASKGLSTDDVRNDNHAGEGRSSLISVF